MPATYTYPGVYIQELPSPVHTITAVATSITAFVGYTSRGIDNRAQSIQSFSDYERLFGGIDAQSELSYAVAQFFQNGGSQGYVVRTPRAGATGAAVEFDQMTFTALSSGTWANGQLLIDVDYSGIGQPLAGTVSLTSGGAAVVGTGTSFTTVLKPNQWLVFASDATQTPYKIAAITDDTHLTLDPAFAGATDASTTALMLTDPLAFNLTVTDLADNLVETFPNVSLDTSRSNYVYAVVNDPDNGSDLVNVQVRTARSPAAPAASGIVGTPLSVFSVDTQIGGALAGTVAVTKGSAAVAGTGSAFSTALAVGQGLVFAADATRTPYVISAIASDTQLTLAANYAEATAASTTVGVVKYVTGTVALTGGANMVTGTGTSFTGDLAPGRWLTFAADPSRTPYQVGTITDDTHLTLAANYSGASVAATQAAVLSTMTGQDAGLVLSVSSPSTPPMSLPVTVKVFSQSAALPQTVSGLAAQLQSAIGSVLAVQMPGTTVQCSVSGTGANQAIRVNALLPQIPDAVLTFAAPSNGLVDASAPLGLSAPSSPNVAHYALGTTHGTATGWGGQQTSSKVGSDGSGLPGTNELIGDPGKFTGMYALQKIDLFNLLSIPDATRASASDPSAPDPNVNTNAIYNAAIALCDQRRAFLLVDPPPNVTTVAGAVDWKSSQLGIVDPNGAAFFPRLRLPDPANNYQLRTFAPSGVVAGVYASTDAARGVWKAPAGIGATLNGVQSMIYKLTDPEQGLLNPLGLNCFRTFPVYGFVLWGARTLAGADALTSQWKYAPVRRMALFLEESLYRGTKWVLFEPNDQPLWAAIRLNVGAFMQTYFLKGAFQGQTPDQAYFVKCDSETTTQTDIDNGIVNILVGFAPVKPAEFVVIQIEQLTGQS